MMNLVDFSTELRQALVKQHPNLNDALAEIMVIHATMLVIMAKGKDNARQLGLTAYHDTFQALAHGQIEVDQQLAKIHHINMETWETLMASTIRTVDTFLQLTTAEATHGLHEATIH